MSGPCAEPFVQAALDPRRHHAIDLLPFPARRVDLRLILLGERLIDPSGMLGAVLRFHFRHDCAERFTDGRMRRFLREVAVIPIADTLLERLGEDQDVDERRGHASLGGIRLLNRRDAGIEARASGGDRPRQHRRVTRFGGAVRRHLDEQRIVGDRPREPPINSAPWSSLLR